MRIVNPLTGTEIFGPSTGHTVTLAKAETRPGDVVVAVSPSMRPGMESDWCVYPADWLRSTDGGEVIVDGRVIARGRKVTETCEALTPGCCIDHSVDTGECETW